MFRPSVHFSPISPARHRAGWPMAFLAGALVVASCGSSESAATEVGGLAGRTFEVAMDFSELPEAPPMAIDCYRFVHGAMIVSDLYPDFDATDVETGTWDERLDGAQTTFTAKIPSENGLAMDVEGTVALGDGENDVTIELRADIFVQGNPIAVLSGSGSENSECVSRVPE